jgi:hypothetical protein
MALWVFPGSATFYLTRFCRPSPIERFLVIWLACKVREGQRTTWAVSLQPVPYCFVFLGQRQSTATNDRPTWIDPEIWEFDSFLDRSLVNQV